MSRLDHVGVIVADLEAAGALLLALGLEPAERIESEELTAAFFSTSTARVELIEVHDPELRAQRLGEGNRARIEHIAFDVGDLGEALSALGAAPNAPAREMPDRSMVWTEPETSGGIMFQLIQRH